MTLIELLLVIVIFGILATIVLISVSGMTSDAEETACQADRRTLEKAAEAFFAHTRSATIPTVADAEEPYEQRLVDAQFLRQTSRYYDLDTDGQILPVAGSPCLV